MKRRAQAVLAARRQPRRRRLPDRRRAPRRRRETDQAPAGCPDLQVRWTPTGISLSVDGLTINADHATNNQYGQRAFVSVGSGDRLCYSQRINLDDPHQRLTFIGKLRLSCEQAGMADDVLTLVEDRVTPGLLVKLGDECRKRPAKPDPDPQAEQAQRTAAQQRAGSLLDDPAILSRVGEAMRANGYAGRLEPALLAYVALTSRLLEERPINLELVGGPAAGKNATIDAALALVPREDVYEFTSSSPMALVYKEQDFQHCVVIFKEADSIPDRGPAASAIRALAEDNVLRYEVTIRSARTGSFETWRIEKPGPTGLITTSTRPVSPQLHTRLLPVPIVNSYDNLTTFQVICAKGERSAGRLPTIDLEPFLALQRWLALSPERRVTIPFGWALARAMGECSLELRTRRDFDALLACVKTIALLHQRRGKQAPGSGIEAVIDDYRVARDLLIGSFSAAATESLTAGIREVVSEIGDKEEVTRPRLRELFMMMPRSTFYYNVRKAIDLDLLSEERRGGKWVLRRNLPLPDEQPSLPDVDEVEGWFFGVPAPYRRPRPYGIQCFDHFMEEFRHGGSEGFTAREWAAWVGQPVDLVRGRLDVLFHGGTLAYDNATEHYAVCCVESPIDSPPAQGEAANPTPASNSSPSPKSEGEQAKSSDVQPSNESGGGTSGDDASTGTVTVPPLQAPPTPRAPESQNSPETSSVLEPEPTATKLPPPARGS